MKCVGQNLGQMHQCVIEKLMLSQKIIWVKVCEEKNKVGRSNSWSMTFFFVKISLPIHSGQILLPLKTNYVSNFFALSEPFGEYIFSSVLKSIDLREVSVTL